MFISPNAHERLPKLRRYLHVHSIAVIDHRTVSDVARTVALVTCPTLREESVIRSITKLSPRGILPRLAPT
jgi:hypothetical protein